MLAGANAQFISLLDQVREFGIPITVFELDRAGRPPIRT